MSIYEDTIAYFKKVISDDATIAELGDDVGVNKIIEVMAYSQEYRLNKEFLAVSEMINPKGEKALLSRLMVERGYLRLQSPVEVSFNIENDSDETIELKEDTEFTSGSRLLLLKNKILLSPKSTTMATARLCFVKSGNVTVGSGFVTKINLGCSYRELVEVVKTNDGLKFNFSQNFIEPNSNAMYELGLDGNIYLVLKNNLFSPNEEIEFKVYTAPKLDGLPTISRLTIIGSRQFIISNIVDSGTYSKAMTTEEMSNALLYDRNILGDIIINSDYETLIKNSFTDIQMLSVWFEKDEEKFSGKDLPNINKVFISYVSKDGVVLDNNIDLLIQSKVRDKAVIIIEPLLIDIEVTIEVDNYSDTMITEAQMQVIKNSIVGEYRTITKHRLRVEIRKVLYDEIEVDVVINMKESTGYYNEFYRVLDENIAILVENK